MMNLFSDECFVRRKNIPRPKISKPKQNRKLMVFIDYRAKGKYFHALIFDMVSNCQPIQSVCVANERQRSALEQMVVSMKTILFQNLYQFNFTIRTDIIIYAFIFLQMKFQK